MSILEKSAVHQFRKPLYSITLSIYSVSNCGKDLQTGSPVEVSATDKDLYRLKNRVQELILSANCEGECFVEMIVLKNGKYYDSDEWWAVVDLVEKKVEVHL